jgi:hypothetical protein
VLWREVVEGTDSRLCFAARGVLATLRLQPPSLTCDCEQAMEEDGAELIDEDELLDDADMAAPAAAAADDCEVGAGGRKACKNCTCGRAEGAMVEKVELTADMLDNPQEGGCGSCALGDAFRCATCPYLGLPAFKPGEKVCVRVWQERKGERGRSEGSHWTTVHRDAGPMLAPSVPRMLSRRARAGGPLRSSWTCRSRTSESRWAGGRAARCLKLWHHVVVENASGCL